MKIQFQVSPLFIDDTFKSMQDASSVAEHWSRKPGVVSSEGS